MGEKDLDQVLGSARFGSPLRKYPRDPQILLEYLGIRKSRTEASTLHFSRRQQECSQQPLEKYAIGRQKLALVKP